MRVDRRTLLAGAASSAVAAAAPGAASGAKRKPRRKPAPPIGAGGSPTPLETLARLARDHGKGDPVVFADLAALDSNAKLVGEFTAAQDWALRPALKAMQSPQLCAYVLQRIPKPMGMLFNLRYVQALARHAPAGTDLLCGWQPTAGELRAHLARKPAGRERRVRVRLLADSVAILEEIARLARSTPRRLPLDVALDLDSGMGRGGFDSANELRAGIDVLDREKERLRVTAVVCYDGHATLNSDASYRRGVAATTQQKLGEYLDVLRERGIDPERLDRNGPASSNYRNWTGSKLITEISPGSAFLFPGYLEGFDSDGLYPAVFQAAPVSRITSDHPTIPYTQTPVPGANEQEILVKMGPWPSSPAHPPGVRGDEASGGGNALVVPKGAVALGDYVLYRPQQSGDAIDFFGNVLAVREGRIVRRWPTLARW